MDKPNQPDYPTTAFMPTPIQTSAKMNKQSQLVKRRHNGCHKQRKFKCAHTTKMCNINIAPANLHLPPAAKQQHHSQASQQQRYNETVIVTTHTFFPHDRSRLHTKCIKCGVCFTYVSPGTGSHSWYR